MDKEIKDIPNKTIISEIISANDAMTSSLKFAYDDADTNTRLIFGEHHTDTEIAENFDWFVNHIPLNLPTAYPKIQSILGYEKINRERYEAEPAGNEDELNAEIYNKIFRNIENQDDPKKYDFSKSDAFGSATIKKFGAIEIYNEKNVFSDMEIKLKALPMKQVCFDNNFNDVEMTGCARIQHFYECYLDDLKKLYPDNKELDSATIESFLENTVSESKDKYLFDDNVHKGKKRVRVIRDFVKLIKNKHILYDSKANLVYEFSTEKEAEAKKAELMKTPIQEGISVYPSEEDYIIKKEPRNVIQYSEVAGVSLIEQKELDIDEIPIKILFFNFIDGEYWSFMDLIRDVVKYIDRIYTQVDYAIGTANKNSNEIDSKGIDTSVHPTTGDVDNVLSQGGNVYKTKPGRVITPIATNRVNPDFYIVKDDMARMMEDAGGGRNMQGLQEGGGTQSGKAIQSLQEAAQVSLTNAIDNVRRFEAQIGRVIVKMIGKYYTHSFTLKVIGSDLTEKMQEALKRNNLYKESMLSDSVGWIFVNSYAEGGGKYWEERPLADTKMSITVKKVSNRIEEKDIIFQKLDMMAQRGYPIPPEVWLWNIDIPATLKTKIISAFEEQKKLQAEQLDMQKKQMEFEGNQKLGEDLRKSFETISKENNSNNQNTGAKAIVGSD
jgi:hypothetical protein